MSPLEKQLGHVSLIMYGLEKTKEAKMKRQADTKFYWRNYIEWHRDSILVKDSMWRTVHVVLETEDFSSLRLA